MRWEPEGKCSTLGAPYSPSPLLPRSSLNTCSIHQTYSTIVFPAQMFCSDSDNTSIPGMWDPQQQIAEEGMQHSTKGSKRGRNGRRLGKIQAVEHKTENPSSVSMNEGERIENHFERAPCCWVLCRLHTGGLWEVVLMCHRKKWTRIAIEFLIQTSLKDSQRLVEVVCGYCKLSGRRYHGHTWGREPRTPHFYLLPPQTLPWKDKMKTRPKWKKIDWDKYHSQLNGCLWISCLFISFSSLWFKNYNLMDLNSPGCLLATCR